MGRSRKLALTDWTAANNALIQHFEGNKSKLAGHVNMSRTTVTDFFNEKPIGESSFRKICLALRLNWQTVSSVDLPSDSSNKQPLIQVQSNEVSIEQVRERCRQKILDQHSRMRLLSGQEIGVDQLYVDVWLLEKPEYQNFNSSESILNSFDIDKDRLALSKRIRRNPGFEIAHSQSKLVILGKPGSGKTTFLKHLGVDWCKGKFQHEKIAVLIELRKIRKDTWHLIDAIDKELGFENWKQAEDYIQEIRDLKILLENLKKDAEGTTKKKQNLRNQIQSVEKKLESCRSDVDVLLKQKSLLVLMDGLDEVPTKKLRIAVREQVREIAEAYYGNQFILTCRTQTISTIPKDFVSVEVARFSSTQVKNFVENWFIANGRSEAEANQQWHKIQAATSNQPDLRELTKTPVLLSLICVVWQDDGAIPTNRTNLYKKGIDWLLNRWNDKKEIDEWEVGTEAYRQLSLEDKEKLLVEIAARKFEDPNNFVLFDQDELVNQIRQKLHLANRKEGIAVLKAIEAQHGLLIERADELWSFSHLTFQEYFTIQWLTQLPHPQLAQKIASCHWQKVVEQLVISQQPADRLLRLIKQATDQLIKQESAIQTFLQWLSQKSSSLHSSYKPAAIRAFYYSLILALDLALDHDKNDFDDDFADYSDRAFSADFNFDDDLGDSEFSHNRALDRALTQDFDNALNQVHELKLDRTLHQVHELSLHRADELDHSHDCELALALDLARTLKLSPALIYLLRQLMSELPKFSRSNEIQRWWLLHGNQWRKQLQQVMIEHRNTGHDWQFTKEQQQQIQRYYEANNFLVDLMNIRGAVSQACRAEIEEGLLLPWAELQRRQPHLYGELQT